MMTHGRGLLLMVAWILALPAGAAAQPQDVVIYYHTDAIGSVRAITDANQQVLGRYDYLPFGEPCGTTCGTPPPPTSRQFAGKEHDVETSFEYFGARFYASGNGRFSNVDPALDVEQTLIDPQRWNRYTYAKNNPLAYVDPDGRDPRTIFRATVLAADLAAPFTGGASLTVAVVATAALGSYEIYSHRREIADSLVHLQAATATVTQQAWDSIIRASRRDPYALPDNFPTVDRTGKVHGPVPQAVPETWTREMLEDAVRNLRESIRNRKEEQKRLGEDGPHRRRIQEEEQLLRQIEKEISGR